MDIEMIRGDTQPIKFQILDGDGNVLKLDSTDELYFTMKKNYKKTDYVLQKRFSRNEITYQEGYYLFTLEHDDTAELKYGGYVYDIQLVSGTIVATIALGTITLTEEATFKANE